MLKAGASCTQAFCGKAFTPVDQETNNFVRQVHNQVFNLLYILFRLDIILPFSPISSEVLTEILNLKTTARDGMDSFLRILAEI